ncbi:MAG: hypothetical protein AB1726_15270 [Planctomycetota bacterium]
MSEDRPVAPRLLLAALLAGTTVLPAQDRTSPLESGDVRELVLGSPAGTRVEHFRLDLEGDPADGAPMGVLRWVSGTWVEDGVPRGLRLETQTIFFAAGARVIHTEVLSRDERKLVYREVRPGGGRTLVLEWPAGGEPRVLETSGGRVQRHLVETARGMFLPLALVEEARRGAVLAGPLSVFSPLAAAAEPLVVDCRDVAGADPGRRELTLSRAGGVFAGSFTFAGDSLARFQWQKGGVQARPISAADHELWRRRPPVDHGTGE